MYPTSALFNRYHTSYTLRIAVNVTSTNLKIACTILGFSASCGEVLVGMHYSILNTLLSKAMKLQEHIDYSIPMCTSAAKLCTCSFHS